MEEMEQALLRHKKRNNLENKNDNRKISKVFTKILLSIILVLTCTIYIKLNPDNLAFFKSHVFESNLSFTKINNWYHSVFGNILPTFKEPDTSLVSSEPDVLKKEEYLDGYKLTTKANVPIKTLNSGLLVFLGEKEGYGNTAIVQGVDGVDIWYGGIQDLDFKLYDYLDAGKIIGNTSNDYYYLLFVKDGQYLNYEDYVSQV